MCCIGVVVQWLVCACLRLRVVFVSIGFVGLRSVGLVLVKYVDKTGGTAVWCVFVDVVVLGILVERLCNGAVKWEGVFVVVVVDVFVLCSGCV